MRHALVLPTPRHDMLGRLLAQCRLLPGLGAPLSRWQRVRRKRFLARIRETADPGLIARVQDHPAGQAFQSALIGWLNRATTPPPLLPIKPAAPIKPGIRCSLVINTVDRAAELSRTLADLKPLWNPRKDELIIVLGPSADASEHVIASCGIPHILVRCPERNLAVSRNLGLQAASGEFIAFLDDDASPCEAWLDALLDPLVNDTSVGASAGFAMNGDGDHFLTRYVVADHLGQSCWWETEEEACRHLAGERSAFLTATGCTMAFRRDQLLALGGFDPFYAYFLEETDLVLRLQMAGHRCVASPRSLVRHRQGANIVRSPAASMSSRLTALRSQLHYIRKFGSCHPRGQIEACVWRRVLADLERIAWEHPDRAGASQTSYLTSLGTALDEWQA